MPSLYFLPLLSVLFLMATLFRAGAHPPGGVWLAGPSAGKSITGTNSPFLYHAFVASNTLAFFSAMLLVSVVTKTLTPMMRKTVPTLLLLTSMLYTLAVATVSPSLTYTLIIISICYIVILCIASYLHMTMIQDGNEEGEEEEEAKGLGA